MTPDGPPDRDLSGAEILAALADLIDDREIAAHEALRVGGYIPLERDATVGIPLALCYAAREALRPTCPVCRGFRRARRANGALTDEPCPTCAGRGRTDRAPSTASGADGPNRPLPRIAPARL